MSERNEVFKTNTLNSQHAMSISQSVKNDFGLEIPVESVPLPSRGVVYPDTSSLHNAETVEIRSMTAREEDILTSKAYIKKGSVISELIKSCLVDKTVNTKDLILGDRNALMVAVRITGYGSEYSAELTCTECGAKTEHHFDLSQLPIKRLDIQPLETGSNLFGFQLPLTKKNIKFRFLTSRDEEEIMLTNEKQKKLGVSVDSSVTNSLLYSIMSIDGIEDKSKISAFVRSMPARDSLALRNFIRDTEPGIEMKQETTCTACGHTEEVSMPLGVNFLWPSVSR
jgi:hypothetical protein